MPGLLRGVARTAVIAGTATAVSNRVSRRQAGRWAQQDRDQYYEQPAYAPPPQPPPPAQETDMDARLSQLRELGELKDRGLLSDDEFEIQKRHILES